MSELIEIELTDAQHSIYERLAEEFGEERIVAAMEHGAVKQLGKGLHRID